MTPTMSDPEPRKVRLVLVVEATIDEPEWTNETLIENAASYFDIIIGDAEDKARQDSALGFYEKPPYRVNTGAEGVTLFTWDDFMVGLKDGTVEADIRGDWRSIPPADNLKV
jgi:hypothetical protein